MSPVVEGVGSEHMGVMSSGHVPRPGGARGVENTASRRLLWSIGFREVGTSERHAKLDGVWRDVVIVERLLGEARL
jgi:hypothetical protein